MNIKELAEQAKLDWDLGWPIYADRPNRFEIFAKLVAAHEREECAKVCDDIDAEYEGEDVLATWCSQAIRARSKA